MDSKNKMQSIIGAAVRDGKDQAAMADVRAFNESMAAFRSIWSDPQETAKALAPIFTIVGKVTEHVNGGRK